MFGERHPPKGTDGRRRSAFFFAAMTRFLLTGYILLLLPDDDSARVCSISIETSAGEQRRRHRRATRVFGRQISARSASPSSFPANRRCAQACAARFAAPIDPGAVRAQRRLSWKALLSDAGRALVDWENVAIYELHGCSIAAANQGTSCFVCQGVEIIECTIMLKSGKTVRPKTEERKETLSINRTMS